MKKARKQLSANGLLGVVHEHFKTITSPRELALRSNPITLTDCLMSGLAMFGLKFPSLLKFDESRSEINIKHNLQTLYHVEQVPCDTYMRTRCDEVDPQAVRKAFKKVFACVQRGKGLEEFEYLDNHYLLVGDGTGFFSSNSVHCKHCCVKHYKKCQVKFVLELPTEIEDYKKNTYFLTINTEGQWEVYFITQNKKQIKIDISDIAGLQEILLSGKVSKGLSKKEKTHITELITAHYRIEHPEEPVTYYHQMFCAAIVHPDKKLVLPLAPEPIMKTDGAFKNDCERNAAKRLYADARREHPHLNFLVVEDSIASNVPHLMDLKTLNMRYIVGVKPGDHKFLFNLVKTASCTEYSHQTTDGKTHRYRYINQVQLNNSHHFNTNFVEYWETDKNGQEQHFSWISDIEITNDNVYDIMRGGRSNWRIENNTFNTLKNQDYHFSHNFGHGNQNLCTIFGMLMMLAFFIDQVQELSCYLFKKARAKFKSRTSLWEKMRGMFKEFMIDSWDSLFNGIAYGNKNNILIPNTS